MVKLSYICIPVRDFWAVSTRLGVFLVVALIVRCDLISYLPYWVGLWVIFQFVRCVFGAGQCFPYCFVIKAVFPLLGCVFGPRSPSWVCYAFSPCCVVYAPCSLLIDVFGPACSICYRLCHVYSIFSPIQGANLGRTVHVDVYIWPVVTL